MKKQSYTITGQARLPAGQVGIIVVLVGIVIFTLGMATAARVTTDVRISSRAEEGQKAFYAAEAAMELALLDPVPFTALAEENDFDDWDDAVGANLPSVRADAFAEELPGANPNYTIDVLTQGQVKTIWLVHLVDDPNSNPLTALPYTGRFRIDWDATNGLNADEVELTILYDSSDAAAEPVVVSRSYFTGDADLPIDLNDAARFAVLLPNFSQFYALRIKPVVGDIENITIDSYTAGGFPTQEFHITAVGQLVNQPVRRRVEGSRFVGEIPLFMDYVVANTGGDLAK